MRGETDAKLAALVMASKSTCTKRKVGAVLVDGDGNILTEGANFHPDDKPCELSDGSTDPNVIHAEINVLNQALNIMSLDGCTVYVTHQPCDNCMAKMTDLNVDWVVVENFMKFDTDKLRYDLIPASSTEALASILTYGAKKYKPNNWKQCSDPERYIAAAMRHLEAYRGGEYFDEESEMPHLWHVFTNIAFLIEFKYDPGSP